MKKADIGVGIGLIIASCWIYWYAGSYHEATIYYYGPNFFPQILALVMGLCAVLLIVNALRGKSLSRADTIDLKGSGAPENEPVKENNADDEFIS